MDPATFFKQSVPFMAWIVNWHNKLETIELDKLAGDPTKVAVVAVDIVEGFCHTGTLASPRVANIVKPIVALLNAAWASGVRNIVLIQDAHAEDAVEFAQFGPHCVRGTSEAEPVEAIKTLPFYHKMQYFEKNSLSSSIDTGFDEWLDMHPEIATFIVVGDCTDLCVYQLAMYLRLRANARQLGGVRVIVPTNCVDTYDLPAQTAVQSGLIPHDGDFLNMVFLYSMMQNGITVAERIALPEASWHTATLKA